MNLKVQAQEYYDAVNSPRQYYYNSLESATAGSPSTFLPGAGSTRSAAATIDVVSSSSLNSSKSFSTLGLASVGYIQWNFMNSSGAAGLNLNARAYEWEFDYKNVTATAPNDPTPNMTAGVDAWRYWLIANSYTGVNSTLGVYITVVNGNLKLISKYGTAGNQWKDYGISISLPTNNHTFQIRVLRSIDGYYYIYVLDRNTDVTSISGSYNVGKTEGALDMSTYNYSYLEATSSASNRFQWDNFNFYTPRIDYVPISGTNSGISDPIYPGMGTAIFYGVNVRARGDIIMGRFVINYTGDITKIFNNSASLYEKSSTPLSTSGATLLKNNYALQNNGSSNQVDLSDLNKHYYSGGNTDGTTGGVINYFFTATALTTFTSGYPTSVTYSVSTTANDNYAQFFSTSPPYNSSSVSSVSAPTASGDVYDWTGANTSWSTSGSWKKNTAASSANPSTSSDIARIGVVAYTGANQPTTSGTTTIGKLIFGSNNTPVLTLGNNDDITVTGGLDLQSSTTATITGGNNPSSFILSGGTSTIPSGSTLIVDNSGSFSNSSALTSAGTITIGGDFANTATGTFTGTGTVNLSRNGNQAISNANATTPVTFYNLNVSSTNGARVKTLSGGKFAIAAGGVLTMSGPTTSLATGGLLTLNSDATGSASVAAIPTGTTITGNVTVQRYVTGGTIAYRGYRLFSSPVYEGVTASLINVYGVAYTKNSAYTTGTTGTTGGFDVTSTTPTIYLYREDKAQSSSPTGGNFRGINKINNTPTYDLNLDNETGLFNIPVGNGFMFFFRGNRATNATTSTTAIPATVTFSNTGTLNTGDISVKSWYNAGSTTLGYTPSASTYSRGFNLVGNPYASTIDWGTFSNSVSTNGIYGPNIANATYVYNAALKSYAVWNGSSGTNNATRYIPSGQGFYVLATAASPALTFRESAKVPTQQVTGSNLLMGTPVAEEVAPQFVRVQLTKDETAKEDIILQFNKSAKETFVLGEDLPYMRGSSAVSLSSFTNDNKETSLAINQVPFPKKSVSIPLNVLTNATGIYQLALTEAKNIPQMFDVWLMDAYKKDSLDIKHNSTYNFNVNSADATTFGADRFKLVVRTNTTYSYKLLDFAAAKQSTTVQLTWKAENEENYTYFTVERSTNGGKTFEVLGSAVGKSQGTYGLEDKMPATGENQYRLKQEDYFGTITYSKIIPVMYTPASDVIADDRIVSVYPNPSSATLNIAIKTTGVNVSTYSISITNTSGRTVKTIKSSKPDWQGNVSDLLPGTYFVQVINNKDNSVVGKSTFIKI